MLRVELQRQLSGGTNSPKLKVSVGRRFSNWGDGLWRSHERKKVWEISDKKVERQWG
jgi:hypothetical protein